MRAISKSAHRRYIDTIDIIGQELEQLNLSSTELMQMRDEFHVLFATQIKQIEELNITVDAYYNKLIVVRKNCRSESHLVKQKIKCMTN